LIAGTEEQQPHTAKQRGRGHCAVVLMTLFKLKTWQERVGAGTLRFRDRCGLIICADKLASSLPVSRIDFMRVTV